MKRGGAATKTRPPPSRAFLLLLVGNVALACGPWLVRLADVGPIAAGFWRLALALPILLAIVARGRGRASLPSGGASLAILLAGLFFAADLAAWHLGILRTKLANAALLANLTAITFPLYGMIVARALPSRPQALAIAAALAGFALLLGRSYELSARNLAGDLLCLAAGLLYTAYMISVDRLRGRVAAWPLLAASTLAGLPPLLAAALLVDRPVWPGDWTPLLMLAIGSQVVGQGCLIYAIGRLPPLVVGLGLLTQPIVAATIGWIGYGERLGMADLAGGLLIAAALLLVRRQPAAAPVGSAAPNGYRDPP